MVVARQEVAPKLAQLYEAVASEVAAPYVQQLSSLLRGRGVHPLKMKRRVRFCLVDKSRVLRSTRWPATSEAEKGPKTSFSLFSTCAIIN